ncbi:MAG TPA: molybdopterin cofactor-binding domain-containing protein [Dehalococcoidia bacterium]|jgi:CO/xanthine dehydrogenase Mo-binding subunit
MKRRGLGLGSMFYGIGYGFNRPDIGAAHVEIAEDGTATLYTGVCDLGQGIQTLLAQIVGNELGLPMEAIRVVDADTGSTPDSGPTSGSRATFVQGQAVRNAALDVKERVLEMASKLLDAPVDDLELTGASVRSQRGGNAVTVLRIVDEMHKQGKRCIGWGWQDITTADVDPLTSQGDAYQTFGWATQLAEVEVDTETGFIKLTRLVSATDAGKAINPLGVEGQVQGGAVMGMGYALYEQHILDHGDPKTASLAFYLVPSPMDVPEVECLIVEVPDPAGPYGAKGVSEPATIPTTPAILNAIYDAVGVRVTETPATPERVFNLLREQEREAASTSSEVPETQPQRNGGSE